MRGAKLFLSGGIEVIQSAMRRRKPRPVGDDARNVEIPLFVVDSATGELYV